VSLSLYSSLSYDSDLLEHAAAIEPLPSSVVRLSQVAADAESDADDIAQILNLDQALLGKVLAEANSANQAAAHTVGTALDAIVRLGSARVVALALSGCVAERLEVAVPSYRLDHGELAFHSQLSAIAAERLRATAGRILPGELVTASLLHDFGKLVIGPTLSKGASRSLNQAREAGRGWAAAEHEIVGVEHGEVGRIILDNWGLPEEIGLAVQYHHSPHLGGGLMAHGVALTDALAHAVLGGNGLDELEDSDAAIQAASALRLKPERIVNLLADVERTWKERTGR